MPFDSLSEDLVIQRFVALVVFGAFTAAAVVAGIVITFIARHMDRLGFYTVAPSIVRTFKNTVPLLLLTLGVVFGLSALPEAKDWRDELRAVLTIAIAVLVAQTVASIIATAKTDKFGDDLRFVVHPNSMMTLMKK